MVRFDPKNTLILVALEAELPNEMIPSWNVAYTGVGKVNAALKGSEYVARYKPMNLINFGTAGALNPELSGLLEVTQFFQRDMDARDMGFALGQTPFEEAPYVSAQGHGLSCGTGDSFVTAPPELRTDLVDMEAFALAKLAQMAGIHFSCFKYVSDQADENSPSAWKDNLADASQVFINKILAKHDRYQSSDSIV
jgi:adenosylhomocysteine nucleosidase